MYQKDNEKEKRMDQLERNKKSKELTDTFVSLYDPNLSPLSCLRTTRGLMNTFLQLIQDITDTLESHLELIHPKQTATYDSYRDDFNFLKAFYKTLRKTNIKLAFTPSKVPPKEYDNTFVWYYSDEDIEKEDPMIVENADDYIYTPTPNSEDKDPLPQAKKKTTRKRYEDMIFSIIHHALRCGDIKKEYTNSEDDMYGLSADDKVDPIKLDEDWVSNVKEYLKDKERKVSHPDEDLLIRITKLIFEWCETADIDPSSAKYHILAELYSMMRRFAMLKSPKEKED